MAPVSTQAGRLAFEKLLTQLDKEKNSEQLKEFASVYLLGTSDREIIHLINKGVGEHLKSAFAFFAKPCKLEVRVHNPKYSKHSVVEIHMPDQPFLVDSIWTELHRRNLEIHHTFHPSIAVRRDKSEKIKEFCTGIKKSCPTGMKLEALIHVEFDRQENEDFIKDIEKSLKNVLTHAAHVYRDFEPMMNHFNTAVEKAESGRLGQKFSAEQIKFLKWLADHNFIFLGYRHYNVSYKGKTAYMALTNNSGLGILGNDKESSVQKPTKVTELPPNMQFYVSSDSPITLTKTLDKSPVHRLADMDYIGIKEFDKKGRVIGEHRFIGLYTSQAYTTGARNIPLVREKIQMALAKETRFGIGTHNHKALTNILETYPRDELFQISVDDLHRIATGILSLKERHEVRLFVRHSRSERLIMAMVYVPRDLMNTSLRHKIIKILMEAYNGEDVEYVTTLGESRLARLFMKIRSKPPQTPEISDTEVEKKLIVAAMSWNDELKHELEKNHGEANGTKLFKTYAELFSIAYQDETPINIAARDISVLNQMQKEKTSFSVSVENNKNIYHLRVFHKDKRISLSEIMPIFDDLGLHVTHENPHNIKVSENNFWIHDFGITLDNSQKLPKESIQTLSNALKLAWNTDLESDELNGLILSGGLDTRQIIILRAIIAYIQQIGSKYDQSYIRQILVKNAHMANHLMELFDARFTPTLSERQQTTRTKSALNKIESGLKDISVLDEDRIIQRIRDIILAMVRTNAFARESITAPLAFKLESAKVPKLPKPNPLYEIFVYHNSVEGVHLRGGMVARGGLRWSDRPADYRTEVLGLMKTQMTKNVVIVPTGSKGGFVLKRLPAENTREAIKAAVEEAYKTFVSSLLTITDNIIKGKVIAPVNVVRHDDDDPYLVVAADKGTATFSDTANAISLSADHWGEKKPQGFWLGDAFASGGSNGYDHKKMGITARGAWVCVEHHFREIGKNIEKEDFSVIGIGDMGGDVFGNGMLLSKNIQLKAAFNHMHIFLDPTPNTAKSYAERQRLFKSVKGWKEYNTKLISKGGGIFERSAKSIPLNKQLKTMLGTEEDKLPPSEIIKLILKMDVDLFWNGGIGTFIKSTTENHADVGDRSNDDLRINADELKAKIVGEGGNLGMTQLARIEYAMLGGRLNTDAIDNSAGVNSSDIEVNFKILLRIAQEKAGLKEVPRNKLLESMTKDVSERAQRNNYLQGQTISIAQMVSHHSIYPYARLINNLEDKGLLNRTIEFLPSEKEIESRKNNETGFTRPELSVMLSYAKMDLYETLLPTKLPGEKAVQSYLTSYFPEKLQKQYGKLIDEHRLKREIISTNITNELINRMGLTFIDRMRDETGQHECTIARAFIISKTIFNADKWWDGIDALDGEISADTQTEMRHTIKKLLEATSFWFLRHAPDLTLELQSTFDNYCKPIQDVVKNYKNHITENMEAEFTNRKNSWIIKGLSEKEAELYSLLPMIHTAPDIATISLKSKHKVPEILSLYFMVGEKLHITDIHNLTRSLPIRDNWQRIASLSIIEQLYKNQKNVSARVLESKSNKQNSDEAFDIWLQSHERTYDKYRKMISEIKRMDEPNLAALNVAIQQLNGLAE